MNLVLSVARLYMPRRLRLEKLHELFKATADAFGVVPPDIMNQSYSQCLQSYAIFTRDIAKEAIDKRRDIEAIKKSLYKNARKLGGEARHRFRVSSPTEARNALKIVYKSLRIEFVCDSDEQVTIPRCYFSRFYSAEICDLVSALDDGLVAGLTNGGDIEFTRRIPEGCDSCRGFLFLGEEVR
jgi:hypothetical protein